MLPRQTTDERLVPRDFILSLLAHMAVPEPKVCLTLCHELRRVDAITNWHAGLFLWDVTSFSYKVVRKVNFAIDGDTEGAAHMHLTIPQKGDDVVAILDRCTEINNCWISFPYDDMFLIGRFEEVHASRVEDHRVEGPFRSEYP